MNQHHIYFSGDSYNGLPELLAVMENGSQRQSAEAAHECFDQLMLEPLSNDYAQIFIPLLIDLLHIRDKSVAKSVILNRISEFLIQEWDGHDVFGVTTSYGPTRADSSAGNAIWRQMMTNRLPQLIDLLHEEEATAIQAIYAIHLLQSDDERIETALLEVTLHTSSPYVRLNGLIALADMRRRAGTSFNPSIAFGQMSQQPLYEAMRAVSMGIMSNGGGMREMDMDMLLSGMAMPRSERSLFPWADGSPTACCAQAARLAIHQLGWSDSQMLKWWRDALQSAITGHQHMSKLVTWEVGYSKVQWDEEFLQWHWNAPMLVADNMLRWRFSSLETAGPFEEQPKMLREALRLIVEHSVDVPFASAYGIKHLLYPAHYQHRKK
ncbi:hypothetical protein [Paenibacillus marinisediminis]